MAMPGQGHIKPRNQTTTLFIKFNHHIPHPFTGRAGGTKQSQSFVSRCLTTPEQLRQSWQTHCNHLIKHCMQANTQTQHAGEEHCWQAKRVSFRWQGPPGAQLSLASHQATQPNHKGGKAIWRHKPDGGTCGHARPRPHGAQKPNHHQSKAVSPNGLAAQKHPKLEKRRQDIATCPKAKPKPWPTTHHLAPMPASARSARFPCFKPEHNIYCTLSCLMVPAPRTLTAWRLKTFDASQVALSNAASTVLIGPTVSRRQDPAKGLWRRHQPRHCVHRLHG